MQIKKYIKILYAILVLTFFTYYLLLYIHYYKSIIGYSDTAFQFFHILQNGEFALFHFRYIAILSQVFAYIGSHLPLDINIVMKAHTANVVLLYALCFSLIAFVFKKKYLALLILMLPSFMQHFSFYYPIHELMYGYCFFMLPITYIYFNIEKFSNKKTILISLITFIFYIFIHPFFNIIGIILFSILLLMKDKYHKKWLIIIAIGICMLFLKIKILSGHEKNHVDNFNFSLLTFQKIKQSYLTYFLKDSLNNRLYLLKYFFISGLVFLLIMRKIRLIILIIIIFISTYIFTYIFLPNGYTIAYMEAYFIPTFASMLFLFFIYLETKFSKYGIVFSIIIIPFCIFGLFRNKSEKLYHNRAKFIENTCRQNKQQCLFLNPNKDIEEILLVGWALPFESLLLSSADGKSKTIYLNSEFRDFNSLKDTTVMLGTDWTSLKLSDLNPKYFHIKPQAYQLIE